MIAYLAAITYLAWATINNHLGDQIYGYFIMIVVSFPLSIIQWFMGDSIMAAIAGSSHPDESGWNYLAFGWSGIVAALVLAVLLMVSRTWRLGRILGWLLTIEVLAGGLLIVIDQWAPRRLWGLPLIACGTVMAVAFIRSHRTLLDDNHS
ncbi:hypothetical protein AB0K21_44350 [Streptosporangium sp. NPDC049248]|uniref:hypothetical protein n=1 Tax=Streptosporangium sp. NPDC049248 TaxID=3155651 RepID=UPI0034345FFE